MQSPNAILPSAGSVARLALVIKRFAEYHDVSISPLSQIILNDTNFLLNVVRAADAGQTMNYEARTYDKAMGHLAALWPSDLPWPSGVAIPLAIPIPASRAHYVRCDLQELLLKKRRKEGR